MRESGVATARQSVTCKAIITNSRGPLRRGCFASIETTTPLKRTRANPARPQPARRWLLTAVLLALGAAALLLRPAPVAAPTATAVPRLYPLPHVDGPERGIQAFLWWHVDNKTGARDADLVRDLGFPLAQADVCLGQHLGQPRGL